MCFVMTAVWITIGPILIVQHLFYRRQGRPAPKVTATLVLMYVGTPALVVWLLVAWLEGAARALMMVVTAYGSAAIDKVAVQKVRAQLRPNHFLAACLCTNICTIDSANKHLTSARRTLAPEVENDAILLGEVLTYL